MFTINIKNIILDYIRLSPKKILQIEKELLEQDVYVSLRHNNYQENEILSIFTSYDKAHNYNLRDAIIINYNKNTLNIHEIHDYISDHYFIYKLELDISKPIYQSENIYFEEVCYIQDYLTQDKNKAFDIPIKIDPIIDLQDYNKKFNF